MTELGKRVIVSLIFIPILLAALYFGGLPMILVFYLLSVLGALEYHQIMKTAGIELRCMFLVLVPAVFISLVFLRGLDLSILWMAFFLLGLQKILVWEKDSSLVSSFAAVWGIIYTGVFPAMITRIELDYKGAFILLGLVVMVWITDSVAYFVGMSLGKHRGVTAISPRKSTEGFIAGVLAPLVIVFILYISGFTYMSLPRMLLVAVAAGIIGQLGDLVESMLKRFAQVKDSSRLIPGHGGILDRMDSILLAGSFLYFGLQLLEKL